MQPQLTPLQQFVREVRELRCQQALTEDIKREANRRLRDERKARNAERAAQRAASQPTVTIKRRKVQQKD